MKQKRTVGMSNGTDLGLKPPQWEVFLSDTRFFDARGSRRLVYPQLVSPGEFPELHPRAGRQQVLEMIQQAEQLSAQLVADLEPE